MSKSIYKNSLYFTLYRIINVVYPLVTATYVSRVLQPEGIGQISIAQTLVIFLTACACLGIPNYGTREVSKKNTAKETSILFSELFITNALSTMIISICYYFVIQIIPLKYEINKSLYYIEGIILILNVINVDWFYQGKEEFKYITIRSLIIKILSVFAIFIFVKKETDICTYAIIFVMAYVGNYFFNILHLKKFVHFTIKGINPKKHLKLVLILAITYISNEIYVTVDTIMLGFMSGDAMAGYYSNAMKLIKILINVCMAMGTALLPRLSRIKHNGEMYVFNNIIKKALKVLLMGTSACALGIILTADKLILVLFGEAFYPSINILMILSGLIIIRSLSNFFLQVSLCLNEDKKTTVVYFCAMLLNVILNLLAIPLLGGQGASIASIISELFIFITLILIVRKHIRIILGKKFIFSLFSSLITMAISVEIAKFLLFPNIIQLGIEIVVGVISFAFIGFITKNDALMLIIDKLKNVKKTRRL